jgi:hypothetical protein
MDDEDHAVRRATAIDTRHSCTHVHKHANTQPHTQRAWRAKQSRAA